MARKGRGARRVTADTLVRAYRKETERQRILVKKASMLRAGCYLSSTPSAACLQTNTS